MGPVLVPLPASVRAAALSEDALADLVASRPLDPLAPAAILSPPAARDRIRAALEGAGHSLVGEERLDPSTAAAGVSPAEVARATKGPLDRWEPAAPVRPLLARFAERPKGAELVAHARARALASTEPAAIVDRIAHERDLEGLVLALAPATKTSDDLAAFARHRVAHARINARSLGEAASALKAGGAAVAREALGFAVRLLVPPLAALEGPIARAADLALADELIAQAPSPAPPLAFLEGDLSEWLETDDKKGPEETRRYIEPATREVDPRAETRGAAGELPLVMALKAALRGKKGAPASAEPAVQAIHALAEGRVEPGVELGEGGALALALHAKLVQGRPPAERRRLHRALERSVDERARALVERALPELAGADRLIADGLAAEAQASSRAEVLSARRAKGALALARLGESPKEGGELARARALLAGKDLENDWELVALAVEEALGADPAALAPRAVAAVEKWVDSQERAPLGFLGGALRLLARGGLADPFAAETREPRRVEARVLHQLACRSLGAELPRDLVEALLDRKRSGVAVADLARKLDATAATAFFFAALPRPLATRLADELGRPDELRIVRRIDASTLEGRFERSAVHVRFFPEDDPPLERARSLVRRGDGPPAVRPVAALEAARIPAGFGVGWALVLGVPAGLGAALSAVPRSWPFFAALADAYAAQHAWGLVHGPRSEGDVRVLGAGLALATFDLEASLGDLAKGRARDLEGLLAAAREAMQDPDAAERARKAAGDLGAEGAATKLAAALRASAPAGWLAVPALDAASLRALLRDVLAFERAPLPLRDIEARIPSYLPDRAAIGPEAIREALLGLSEEGWASGEFAIEVDAPARTWRLVESAP